MRLIVLFVVILSLASWSVKGDDEVYKCYEILSNCSSCTLDLS